MAAASASILQKPSGKNNMITQYERNRKSREKLGQKTKAFTLDADTLALFEQLAVWTGKSHVQILKDALYH